MASWEQSGEKGLCRIATDTQGCCLYHCNVTIMITTAATLRVERGRERGRVERERCVCTAFPFLRSIFLFPRSLVRGEDSRKHVLHCCNSYAIAGRSLPVWVHFWHISCLFFFFHLRFHFRACCQVVEEEEEEPFRTRMRSQDTHTQTKTDCTTEPDAKTSKIPKIEHVCPPFSSSLPHLVSRGANIVYKTPPKKPRLC